MFASEKGKKKEQPKNYDEYILLREIDKRKLHFRYICGFLFVIIVWLIATGTASNTAFVDWVSFASTITSIILSVLAIIMSMAGEGKTEHIREQLSETAKRIKESQDASDEINESIEKNLEQLRKEIERLSKEVENVPKATAQAVTEFQNKKDSMNLYRNTIRNRTNYEWEKSNEGNHKY